MAANPATDQYLAMAKADRIPHTNCPSAGCPVERNENEWIANLLATLPDVDPAIVGQVLLHTGTLLQTLTSPIPLFDSAPHIVGPYLQDTLRNLGADVLSRHDGDTTGVAR